MQELTDKIKPWEIWLLNILHFVSLLLTYASVGLFLGLAMRGLPPLPLPLDFLQALASYFLVIGVCVFVHELGHVLGFLLMDFRLVMFALGPLHLIRWPSGWKVQWRRQQAGGLTGAHSNSTERLPLRQFVGIAGGPLASLLLAVAGFTVYSVRTDLNLAWQIIILTTATLSLLMFLSNLLPISAGDLPRDGLYLFYLPTLKGQSARRYQAAHALMHDTAIGKRPAEWDPAMLAEMTAPSDKVGDVLTGAVDHYYADLDRGEIEQAGKHLATALELKDTLVQRLTVLYLEAAYIEALYGRGAEPAQKWFSYAVINNQTGKEATWARAEAAILLAEGKLAEALEKAQEGLAWFSQVMPSGMTVAEKEWLQKIVTEANTALETGAARQPVQRVTLPPPSPPAPLPGRETVSMSTRPVWTILAIAVFSAFMFGGLKLMEPPLCSQRLLENLGCKTVFWQSYLSAQSAYSNYDYASAVEQYSRALATGVATPDLYYQRANAYYGIGDYSLAIEDAHTAIQLLLVSSDEEPDYLNLLNYTSLLYEILYRVEDYDSLVAQYQREIANAPDLPGGYCKMALAHSYSNAPEKSISASEAGQALDRAGEYTWCWSAAALNPLFDEP